MKTKKPVCVTGASGFIASHIVKQLLEQGYRVRGTVRKSSQNYPFLLALPGAAEHLELVEADLLAPGSYDKAVEGCDYVMHTASPYKNKVKNPQTDLVDPAVNGTETLLESCLKSGCVKRVILTSSIAAITDEPDSTKIFTEKEWNIMSSLDRNPYHYSKTLAELAAWDFIMKKRPPFDLIAINPFMVIGPSLAPSLNTSNEMIRDIMIGVYPGIIDINWGFVDVRDVAKAHILAMETDTASGRYLCSAEALHMREVVALLKSSGFDKYALPKANMTGKIGTLLMKGLSFTQPKDIGMYIRTTIGRTMHYDNSKIRRELGISFMPVRESLIETIKDMVKWGHLTPPKK
ncbi:SDR family oxidoreductase [Pelodictyon phaeoclathratiforme]|jgi:dihydroflavonol-4-reductase|uniref:NAD-dependent epimerase/dehydratase n=1 Tax=Pelodictyon phaeoclathratiforme (strain DSM 5477 / BU-1) TaxID=324925 RepID=B4SEY5_PELPB|nr:aldehyde reductase [Pelodictyon phaeoclathratiforme]ACF43132.1 NAD-dependent epimerase/dehydratase [Pelodictyon phaeoclathratiforme BU-1]MBV5289935.1 aldehyde reductase [Pelodictyon phaeoclathratiforme]